MVVAVSENRNGRPTSPKVETANVSDGDLNETDSTRCRVCQHPLSATLSVSLGIGPECRRAAGREVVA
ncbi:DUF6011 domain-containing protein [Nocardioides salarius]|uniref:DUF6011 domain-containing protein n=1 Tax=Nocardioides salarius TaxID=374513 RepID=UPI0035576998